MARALPSLRAPEERRRAPRIKVLIDVLIDPACDGTYVFARGTAVSADGLFIQTAQPEPIGTALRLRIDDDGLWLEFEGVVAWTNPPGTIDPGMGVRLVRTRASDRRRLLALVGRVAYLA